MDLLNQSAFLKALGWSLLNSFWQFGVLWMVFLVIHAGKKTITASLKHALALGLLVVGFVWFAAGLSYRYFAYSEIPHFSPTSFLSDTAFGNGIYQWLTAFLDNNLSYISGVYLVIVAALFVKFFRYFYYSHKIQTSGLIKIKPELRLFVEQLTNKLDIKKKVQVWLSQYVDTPIIVGFLKPTILIPVACMNQLTIQQLEAVILHELAHIKRNDYLLNLFIAITEIVFFFNPFSRLFTRIIQQERENSCDDWVLQFKFDRYEYASALLSLEKNRAAYFPLAIAATGNKNKTLLLRIQRIMQVNVSNRVNGIKLFAYFLSIGLLALVAYFNPGDVVIRNLAKEFPPVEKVLFASREVKQVPIKNDPPLTHTTANSDKKKQHLPPLTTPTKAVTESEAEVESPFAGDMLFINTAELAVQGFDNTTRFIAAVQKETRDFSKTDEMEPVVPEIESIAALPFVPTSSFSYLFVDTAKPKVKGESYYERNARASLVKAKKAVEQIDWEKIEKQLKNKIDISKLKKEIEKSLEEVNWQEINEEVNLSLSKEDADRIKALREEAEEVTRYKAQQVQLQKLETELNLRREYYKKDLEKQHQAIQDLQRQEKKKPGKIIVYI
jgi:beta-lactamase regulating signal transducer with metallopeptidase domain